MANVLLTNVCNRGCSFCFAGSRINSESRDEIYISRENLRQVMDFMANSCDKQLRLLGGEPTLHPEIIEIIEEAIIKDFHVHLFTNGFMKKDIADYIGKLSSDSISVLCNVSPQANDSEEKVRKRNYALQQIGNKGVVGVTLTEPLFEPDPLIKIIEKYNLKKRIRVGLAQPIVGRDNIYLHPSEYRTTAQVIMEAATKCVDKDILLGFDCGFTLCMFSEKEIGFLMKNTEGFNSCCTPIIDIGTNLEVCPCFPFSEYFKSHLSKFSMRSELVEFYNKILRPYRGLGCMPECFQCKYLRRGQCSGGCVAHSFKYLKSLPYEDAHKYIN